MISWAAAHRSALIKANRIHRELGTPMDRPVDVFNAVAELGVVLAFAPLGRTSGLYLPAARKGGTPGILLHAGHPRTRQRYTAGHELGHHVFGHAPNADGDLEDQLQRGEASGWSDIEKEAEAFGGWMLMPRQLVLNALGQLGLERPRTAIDVYSLSLWLGTSYTATARQMATLKLVDHHVADHWAKLPPHKIKRAVAQHLVPDDLRNDVWWLDERSNGKTIEARPGDRLVLTLTEIPSSGISWRFAGLPAGASMLADSFEDPFEPQLENVVEQEEPFVAGASATRSFVIELPANAQPGTETLRLVKDAEWDPRPPSDAYELTIALQAPLRGLQIDQSELALTA